MASEGKYPLFGKWLSFIFVPKREIGRFRNPHKYGAKVRVLTVA
jgi:hypothetical protein